VEIDVDVHVNPLAFDVHVGETEVTVTTPRRVVEVEIKQPLGTAGPPGPPGDVGSTFVHTQDVAALTWHVQHDLGYHPNAAVTDTELRVLEAEVQHNDENSLTVSLDISIPGFVFCS